MSHSRSLRSSLSLPVAVVVAGSIALAAALPERASAQPLTLDSAQRIALERSQLLRAQDSSIAASRDMAIAAGQLPDPVVKIGIDNLPVENPDRFSVARDFMTMRRIGVMQEFTGLEKRKLKTERFEREADRTLAEKNAITAQIERDVALAWLDRLFAERIEREIAEQIRLSKLETEAVEGVYRGGRGTAADLVSSRTTTAMLDDRAREAAGRVRIARNALGRWVPDSAGELGGPLPDVETLSFDPRALDDHLAGHPELQALTRQEAIADTELRLAQANRSPDWTWEVAYQQRGSSYANMVSVGVSIPLQWDRPQRQDREVAAKRAQIDEVRARREETFRAHRAELAAMIVEWETLRERVGRYRGEVLKLTQERSEALTSAYRTGRTSSLVDVIAAQRGESDARIQILNFEAQIAKLWAQIRFIVPHAGHASAMPAPLPTERLVQP